PMPLVIALHGGGGNGAQLARSAGLVEKARAAGFILALPEGSARIGKIQTWNAGGCCAYAMRAKIDDVGFIRALIDAQVASGRVDPRRVYVVGMSNGGMMAHRIAIALGDRIAAAAVFVGALFGNESAPVAPVPLLIVNAANDQNVPVPGGIGPASVSGAQSSPYKPSVYAARWWATANRCAANPASSDTADYARQHWAGCVRGADVDFYLIKDAEHGWPGGTIGRPGVTRSTGRVNGTDLMWAFFAAHHR
ncbi:MAG: phospholipase, partial [Sphingomonas sp.]|uniref:alpha/beta hydrolase family esterase n=1 Tax=Sphingomonas sp. TaxID=28214 RepID=UPI0012185DE1